MSGKLEVPESQSAPTSAGALSATETTASAAPAATSAATTAMPLLGGPASALTLSLTMFVEAVGYGVVAPTLPFLARGFGAGEVRIGFLVGLYAAVGLLASVPCG